MGSAPSWSLCRYTWNPFSGNGDPHNRHRLARLLRRCPLEKQAKMVQPNYVLLHDGITETVPSCEGRMKIVTGQICMEVIFLLFEPNHVKQYCLALNEQKKFVISYNYKQPSYL